MLNKRFLLMMTWSEWRRILKDLNCDFLSVTARQVASQKKTCFFVEQLMVSFCIYFLVFCDHFCAISSSCGEIYMCAVIT